MSAFAALSAFSGDDDILAAQKKKLAQEAMQREREAQASAQAFADFKAKAGQSNWADEDDEDDFYLTGVGAAQHSTSHGGGLSGEAHRDRAGDRLARLWYQRVHPFR